MAALSDFNKKLQKAMGMRDEKPFMSINKLAEYMEADAIRRRQIVKEMKKDSDYRKLRYKPVRDILKKYFKSGYDDSIIHEAIAKVEAKKSGSEWEDSDHPNSILALKHLLDTSLPDLDDYNFVTDINKVDKIELSDVVVSIKPDIYMRNKHSGKIGGVKVHIAKTEKIWLNKTSREYAAVLIKYGFLMHGYSEKGVDNNACISVDVFQEDYSTSPRAYKLLLGRLEASCEEIALRWDSI